MKKREPGEMIYIDLKGGKMHIVEEEINNLKTSFSL